jgi:hypothetical protein
VADVAARFLDTDVHGAGGSEETAADEIRGQIGAPPAPATTGTIHIVKSTTPAGGTGFGFADNVPGSPGAFSLNDGATHTFTGVPPGTYTFTEALPSGYTLTDVTCSDSDSSGNPFARTATVALQAGEVVTCTFRNLRTFTGPTLFVFNLSGSQEVPPVPTTDRGGCMGQFDTPTRSLSIVCTHNVVGPAQMHIHQGAVGVNGPILFDLGDPQSPVEATWTGMTPAEVAALMSGNLYINIHSGGRPAGAIRGQILPRTVDQISFAVNAAQEVPPTGSTATGTCSADLNDNATSLLLQCNHNAIGVTNTHLHSAPPGVDGPVVADLPASQAFTFNVPMTPRIVADFAAGFLYVNVHTVDFPMGEIRGQVSASNPAVAAEPAGAPTLVEWAALLFALSLAALALWRLR